MKLCTKYATLVCSHWPTYPRVTGTYHWTRNPAYSLLSRHRLEDTDGVVYRLEHLYLRRFFRKKLLDSIEGLPGVTCIADDVLIHGKTAEDHDRCLELFLKRCQETGIKLNKSKLQLPLDKIVFMGHLISKDGLKSDPDKVKAITNMKPPTSLQELRRYLGMVNYLAKFLPNLSDIE